MATNRGHRVTTVSPWIPGGEGQLRDLIPLPPWLFLLFRGIGWLFRHYYVFLVLSVSIYLWVAWDWSWWQAFLLFPILFILTRLTLIAFWLWYRNPTIPLFARRN